MSAIAAGMVFVAMLQADPERVERALGERITRLPLAEQRARDFQAKTDRLTERLRAERRERERRRTA